MPLSRLENFLVNTDGNILYVNPSDLDATDSFDNKGNSLTRPFVSIQRALLEAARFSYQSGDKNDRYDKTTILLYPGTHYIDNRPGFFIKQNGASAEYYNANETIENTPNIEITTSSNFDLNSASNMLYKFNSVDGGVIVPKGTSIVGLDLRKTKVKPLYVPDPTDSNIARSAIFRVTGGCYFWQFSIFDADRKVFYNLDYSKYASPSRSHHKLTCFEYADGINTKAFSGLTDLAMYYYKLMNAYGQTTENRRITDFPTATDFEPNSPEFKIVGDLKEDKIVITKVTAAGTIATIETTETHGLSVDDSVRVTGIGSGLYNGSKVVTGITSATKFTYLLPSTPADTSISSGLGNAKIEVDVDNVQGASPYVFNCSLRSVYGMCGLHADGDKATGFKSMVVAQFTGIGLQKDDNAFLIYNKGTGAYNDVNSADSDSLPLYTNQEATYNPEYGNYHIKASNDAFIQAVSTFAIGFANHFVSDSGSDQSITNSNSNFGSKSLVSKGFRKDSFNRDDTGYVTHIVPPKDLEEATQNILWSSLDVNKTVSVGTTQKLYLDGEIDKANPPTNVVNGYKIGAKLDEKIYLNVTIGETNYAYSSPLLMQISGNTDGPASEKRFVVDSINTTTNTISFVGTSNFINGESVRIYSDNGETPDGLENEQVYYISNVGAGTTCRLAKSFNAALAGSDNDVINIRNSNGGVLSLVSRVTDKVPGDLGHPIQYDNTQKQWYAIGAASTITNTIYYGFTQNQTQIAANNSSTYVQRKSENRDLNDRIYKLRYVIPKEYTNPIAKAPSKNYVLQESSSTGFNLAKEIENDGININRNPRIIAGITTANLVATVVSETPHKLSEGDRILITQVTSSENTSGAVNSGYNGYYYVESVPSTKSFTYNIPKPAGTFTNDLKVRNNTTTLPLFSRNEYDTSYTIQDVETVQEYATGQQDGIYYLTCVIGNITPSADKFTAKTENNTQSGVRFKQNIENLYPTVDIDNPNVDPYQAISIASNETIGKVYPNDTLNSLSKETVLEYIKDNRVGFGVTYAVGNVSGVSTISTGGNHDLNSITSVTVSAVGAGYSSGATTLYNVPLIGVGTALGDATANVYVNGSGAVSGIKIVDGGSAYGIGNTMVVGNIGQTTNALVTVTGISTAVGKVIQVTGVGTDKNRTNSGYNGLYKITGVPDSKSVTYDIGTGNAGIYTGNPEKGVFYVGDKVIGMSALVGVANTTLAGIVTITTNDSHGLAVGNRIKISGVTGAAAATYNSDFIVQGVSGISTFTINSTLGIGTNGLGEIYRYPLASLGQDTSLETEKISGSLLPLDSGVRTKLSASVTEALDSGQTFTTINCSSTVGIHTSNFVQIDNEILRVQKINSGTQIRAIRGVLGTKPKDHDDGSVVRKIDVIPSEVRRFSSIRASGHTFEYLGYGPGNYATALPQRHVRTITQEEELLAISREEKGGVVFYSGMNDRGDFFSGERKTAIENYLGITGSNLTATFDDVYIRNTLRVGGGSNRNLPSEFRGPVNFSNKITSTAGKSGVPASGIEGIKLLLKGNPTVEPSLQVGSDNNPSLIIKELTQNVGIKTANPAYELDVSGTIRATKYNNFALDDLPTPSNSADVQANTNSTFGRNKILKVNDSGDNYELVDVHELEAYKLRSLGISNDPTVYVGIGTTVSTKLQVSGISTAKFYIGEKVKVFGVSPTSTSAISAINGTATKIGTVVEPKLYNYWIAEFHQANGHFGPATIVNAVGIAHTSLDNFNDLNYIALSLTRSSADFGVLVYRQEQAAGGIGTAIGSSKLIGIACDKDFGSSNTTTWKDYGNYDQTAWSTKGTSNEFDADQIHFPNIGTTGSGRGWAIDSVVEVGTGYVKLGNGYGLNNNVGFGTTADVKIVHDNTYAFTQAIDATMTSGGNYLDLPSGTYLTNRIVIPSSFTIKGNGKNSVLKMQYFASDLEDGAGNALSQDGNLVGIGTTLGPNPPADGIARDITIQDLTIDGNSSNNINYEDASSTSYSRNNYLLYMPDVKSTLIRGVEVRNSTGAGLWVRDSHRLSVENSSFVDGCLSDLHAYPPLDAQGSTSLRVNDSLFENYPGALDVSTTSVVSTGGNIIRNCGTGIRFYATGKITTSNNIILGPADEWIPSPDIYDSDYNSINITVDNDISFESPTYLYVEQGDPKDLTAVTVSGGIGTMLNVGGGTTETIGPLMSEITLNFTDPGGDFSQSNGYLQFNVTATDTAVLGLSSAYGYQIKGTEFRERPVGYSTYVGIGTGVWGTNAFGSGAGVANTSYYVTFDDVTQYTGISTGSVVKLVGHQSTPNLSSYELTVVEKKITAGIHSMRLEPVSAFPTTAAWQDANVVDGLKSGYISIRNVFIIAKGRVGVI